MSDFDPRHDPNRANDPVNSNWEYERPSHSWGWIVGGLAVVALLLAALTMGRDGSMPTAGNTTNPPTQVSRPATPPAPASDGQASTPAPTPPSTTGQSNPQ